MTTGSSNEQEVERRQTSNPTRVQVDENPPRPLLVDQKGTDGTIGSFSSTWEIRTIENAGDLESSSRIRGMLGGMMGIVGTRDHSTIIEIGSGIIEEEEGGIRGIIEGLIGERDRDHRLVVVESCCDSVAVCTTSYAPSFPTPATCRSRICRC